MSFRTRILTAEGSVLDEDADALVLPVPDGRLGVLSGHAPMLVVIAAGVLALRKAGETSFFAMGAGTAELGPAGASIFTESAVRGADEYEAESQVAAYAALLATPVPSAETG
jgi:F-type H+-transporting ATPase subunit epsilon